MRDSDILWIKGGKAFKNDDLNRLADAFIELRLTGKERKIIQLSDGCDMTAFNPSQRAVTLGALTGVPCNFRVETSPPRDMSFMIVERAFKQRVDTLREELLS